jgi:ArsR family transcriptional regulator, nickel/cobalt-responsive transcriptional repressor
MHTADTPAPHQPLPAAAADGIADVMFALSTPSRLQILACLRGGALTVSEIVRAVRMEQTAVSHQLRVLRDHSVVSVQRRGRERLYTLHDEHIAALLDHAHQHVHALTDEPGEPALEQRSRRPGRAAS